MKTKTKRIKAKILFQDLDGSIHSTFVDGHSKTVAVIDVSDPAALIEQVARTLSRIAFGSELGWDGRTGHAAAVLESLGLIKSKARN